MEQIKNLVIFAIELLFKGFGKECTDIRIRLIAKNVRIRAIMLTFVRKFGNIQ